MIKAQSLLEQKDTTTSMIWIDSLLVKNPKEGNAWSFKGRYALSKHDYQLADSCLSKSIELSPNEFELYISRAQARHALGQFGLAIEDYDKTIQLQPKHFVAHYNRGLLRSFVGDYNRAITDFDFILQIEPDNTLAMYNRAQLREKTGDFKGAISDYSKLIKEYPNFYYGYEARSKCRRMIGDIKGALNDESIIARKNLDIAYGRNSKTGNKKVRLRSEHELDQYQQLVEEKPDTARNVFGTLYGKVQNEQVELSPFPMYALAFRSVHTRGYHSVGYLSELSPFHTSQGTNRRFCLTASSESNTLENAEAEEARLRGKLATFSKLEQALVMSAIYAAKYDYSSAINEANKAIQADSTSIAARIQRSTLLMRNAISGNEVTPENEVKSHIKLAIADLKIAQKYAPNNAYVLYNLACVYQQQKMYNTALEALNKAIDIDARLPEAYYNRGLIYLHNNNKDKAFTDFSKAGQLGLYKAYALMKKVGYKN